MYVLVRVFVCVDAPTQCAVPFLYVICSQKPVTFCWAHKRSPWRKEAGVTVLHTHTHRYGVSTYIGYKSKTNLKIIPNFPKQNKCLETCNCGSFLWASTPYSPRKGESFKWGDGRSSLGGYNWSLSSFQPNYDGI